jgi:hypothetical protein
VAEGEAFGGGQGAAFAGVQTIVTTLQNLVLAVNALTAAAKTQFGESAVYKAASLPAAGQPARAFVSDSTVSAAGNFGATVVGSGTHTVPVYFDNLTWKIG